MAPDGHTGAERGARLDRRSVGHDVAEHIRQLILAGTLRPNEKIAQDEVAAELGVSRIPVREALLTLAADGVVVIEPYRGAFVAALERADIHDQFELYGLVHGFAASRATRVITDEQLAQLKDMHATFVETTDVDRLDELDWDFHRSINRIEDSGRLRAVLRTLTTLSRNVPRSFFLEVPNAKDAAIEAHSEILDGLEKRDGDRAAAACFAHLASEGQHVVEVMERNGFWDPDSDGAAKRKASEVTTRQRSR